MSLSLEQASTSSPTGLVGLSDEAVNAGLSRLHGLLTMFVSPNPGPR